MKKSILSRVISYFRYFEQSKNKGSLMQEELPIYRVRGCFTSLQKEFSKTISYRFAESSIYQKTRLPCARGAPDLSGEGLSYTLTKSIFKNNLPPFRGALFTQKSLV